MKLLINPVSDGPHWGGPDYLMIIVDDAFEDFLAVARRSAKVAAEQAGDKFNILELDIDNNVSEFWVEDPDEHFNRQAVEYDDGTTAESDFVENYLIMEGDDAWTHYDGIGFDGIGYHFPRYGGLSCTTAKVDRDGDVWFIVNEGDNEFCCEYPM